MKHKNEIPVEIIKISEEYISDKKNWSREDYDLRFVIEKNGYIFISVDHKDDTDDQKFSYVVGGGTSIQLMIDLNTLEVIKELRYQ